MTQRSFWLICVLFVAVVHAVAQDSNWKRYTIGGEDFSVALPQRPALKTRNEFVKRFQDERVVRTVELDAGEVFYRIAIYENVSSRQLLADFIAEQTKRKGWDLTTERVLSVDGNEGKEYISQNKHVIVQFFASEGRLYRFETSGATSDNAAVKQFFSSIVLGRKGEGIDLLDGSGSLVSPYVIQDVFKGKDVDRKVQIFQKPEPMYTPDARKKEIEGTVILRAVFSSSGEINNIEVIKGLPEGLTERAIAAARLIKFKPAMKDGKPVSMWMQLEYNFNLH